MSKQRGFTLIEILVVIAIIGVLATIILAAVGSAREKAAYAKARSELRQINLAMRLLYDDTGFYPSNLADQTNICYDPPGANEIAADNANAGIVANGRGWAGWNGPYMNVPIEDPWGRSYYFDSDYDCSAGPVGCEGHEAGGQNDSVIVSCGPNDGGGGSGGSCEYDADNIVFYFCEHP